MPDKFQCQASISFKHAPIEVPLVGFLSLLSICAGRSRALEVKGSWQETGNIYIALVGDSGVGKSHCFNVMLKPVWNEDFRRKQEWEAALARYNEIMEARSKDKAAAQTRSDAISHRRRDHRSHRANHVRKPQGASMGGG